MLSRAVPLFDASDEGVVSTRVVGRAGRHLLRRSADMEALVRQEAGKAVADHTSGRHQIDGLIYMMGWIRKLPLPVDT